MNLSTFAKGILFIALLSLLACSENDKKVEKYEGELKKSDELMTETQKKVKDADSDVEEKVMEKINYDFLKGTWTGKFDGRNTILNITETDANSFKGKINIKYRKEINQEVTGYFNPEDNSVTMEDQLHSRYKGKYEGQLTEDKMGFAGQFTMKLDGKKFNFSLKKK